MNKQIKVINNISIDSSNRRLCGLDCPKMSKYRNSFIQNDVIERASCYLGSNISTLDQTKDYAFMRTQFCLDSEEVV
jgi:hypothetical protein